MWQIRKSGQTFRWRANPDYVVDMSDIPSWKGTLTQIRIDPASNVSSGSFSIDFVEIFSGETLVQNDEKIRKIL
ncbi:MAG: hypothetical protein GWP06_07945 [Actinobacteria bacterium]|nr:hypothetical protein [Actinomycetota bacterium]